MKVYTYSQARQKLASILDQARSEGEVRVKRRDGQEFVIRPIKKGNSPLDIQGIDSTLSAEEIVSIVREGRERS